MKAMTALLYLIPAILLFFLGLLSGDETLPEGGDETKGIRGRFTRMGAFLYRAVPFFRKPGRDAKIGMNLGMLDPSVNPDEARRLYYADKIGVTLMLICAGSVLACLISVSARNKNVVDENGRIERNGYGTGSHKETLVMEVPEDPSMNMEIELSISDRQYTKEQADELFMELAEKLPEVVLGDNPSLDDVTTDLTLIKKFAGYPFDIAWIPENYAIIHSDGKLQQENIPQEGITVRLTAKASYMDDRWETDIYARILPPHYTGEELWERGVKSLLEEADRATIHEEYIELPESIGESTYTWTQKVKDDAPILFLFILIAAVAVYAMKDKDLEKKVKEREEEMISDYPQFVSKLVLYLGAGMTVRNVFRKLAGDYEKLLEKGESRRFLYEELKRTIHEIDSGISENTAYEHFSRRCRSKQYTRLCTLLSQNLRKGNSGLLPLLQEESAKALSERMDIARKRGEEAGTKLLLPMILMLVIVMVMIIMPAYTSL